VAECRSLAATCLSTLLVGTFLMAGYNEINGEAAITNIWHEPLSILNGWPFALAIMSILCPMRWDITLRADTTESTPVCPISYRSQTDRHHGRIHQDARAISQPGFAA
jgi:hypothetical protein